MDDFLNSQIACSKHGIKYWIDTDCWFNHKDLEMLLDNIEKIGQVELEDSLLGVLSPAHTLDDIYNEITKDIEISPHTLNDAYCIIKRLNVEEY